MSSKLSANNTKHAEQKNQEIFPALHTIKTHMCFSTAQCGVKEPEEAMQTGL